MIHLAHKLIADEAGFVVSAELVLIATIAVLSMVVGLSEVAWGINEELEDVGSAYGSVNQTFRYSGVSGHKGVVKGSCFEDGEDFCDGQYDLSCDNSGSRGESGKYHD